MSDKKPLAMPFLKFLSLITLTSYFIFIMFFYTWMYCEELIYLLIAFLILLISLYLTKKVISDIILRTKWKKENNYETPSETLIDKSVLVTDKYGNTYIRLATNKELKENNIKPPLFRKVSKYIIFIYIGEIIFLLFMFLLETNGILDESVIDSIIFVCLLPSTMIVSLLFVINKIAKLLLVKDFAKSIIKILKR